MELGGADRMESTLEKFEEKFRRQQEEYQSHRKF